MNESNLMIGLQRLPMLVGVNALLTRLSIHQRIRSAILDHLAMVIVFIVILSPLFVYHVYRTIQNGQPLPLGDQLWAVIYACFANSIYVNKDALQARSIGKRICGLQLIDRKTKEAASPLKCLLRNVTILIWPLELIAVLVTRNRRIGDLIANTEIVQYDQTSSVKPFKVQILISILIGTMLFFLLFKLHFFGDW